MIDILVISHACCMAINRKVYQLFIKEGWNVELIVPEELFLPTGFMKSNPPMPGDPPIRYLKLVGNNPRTYTYKGIIDLLAKESPLLVLLDNDPVSRLAGEIGKWCRKNNSQLLCISNENLSLGLLESVKRRGIRNIPAALIKRVMLKRNRKLVNGIFCINTEGKKIFESEGFDNVWQMPLGFDPAVFFQDIHARERIREKEKLNTKVIAYFGRLTPEKGIHILIEALKEIKNLDWQLMMDHFDEYTTSYNREVKKQIEIAGIGERVVYVHPDHFEVAGYMNAADIIIVPSVSTPTWKEQYGRVAAEAMACGKLVVASNSGALPDLLNGYGVLFSEGNVGFLVKILKQFLAGYKILGHTETEVATYSKNKLSITWQKIVMEKAFRYILKKNNKAVSHESIIGRQQ